MWSADEVNGRVALSASAGEGMGVQIKELRTVSNFGWQILNSAKDWQDQLLSEITGQRERIARVFLTSREGGLNLKMPPDVSRQLMRWGYEAGCKFTDGEFDFEEHKWRRLLALYKHLEESLDAIENIWNAGFGAWYERYVPNVKSYKKLTLADGGFGHSSAFNTFVDSEPAILYFLRREETVWNAASPPLWPLT